MNTTDFSRPEHAFWFYRTQTHGLGKLGGLPNLPDGLEWPETPQDEFWPKVPLHFIGQIDLGALPWDDLGTDAPAGPREGMLFFFSLLGSAHENFSWMENAEDDGTRTRVLYAKQSGVERGAPESLPSIADPSSDYDKERFPPDDPIWRGIFPAHPISVKVIETAPHDEYDSDPPSYVSDVAPDERDRIAQLLGIEIPTLSADIENYPVSTSDMNIWNLKRDAYPVVVTEVTYTDKMPDGTLKNRIEETLQCRRHQMFGLAPTVQFEQGSTRHQTDRVGERAIPLMTFDSDTGVHPEFIFCEGIMQFWIDPDELAKGHFDNVHATAEGG